MTTQTAATASTNKTKSIIVVPLITYSECFFNMSGYKLNSNMPSSPLAISINTVMPRHYILYSSLMLKRPGINMLRP